MIGMFMRQPWARVLCDDDIKAIAAICKSRTFPDGRMIFQRDDEGHEMYLIVAGRVRLSVLSPQGRELALDHAGPGSIVGEMAVLTGRARSADATAVGQIELLAITRRDLDLIIMKRPTVAKAFIELLCDRITATTEQLESIALYGLQARLARLILRLSRKILSHPDESAVFELDLTQSDLADLIGASRPKVNQALAALAERRAIRRMGRRIKCDVARLEDIADGEA